MACTAVQISAISRLPATARTLRLFLGALAVVESREIAEISTAA